MEITHEESKLLELLHSFNKDNIELAFTMMNTLNISFIDLLKKHLVGKQMKVYRHK